MRKGRVSRETTETTVKIEIVLDGTGKNRIDTGIATFDHLLGSFSKHGLFDLTIESKDLKPIDGHHLIEDVGIVLGNAVKKALKDKKGIRRFGYAITPMDDALALVSLDISGRGVISSKMKFSKEKVGDLQLDLIPHFLQSFGRNSGINLHARVLSGRDDHHKVESLFKAFGLALRQAAEIDERRPKEIPSQKGLLE